MRISNLSVVLVVLGSIMILLGSIIVGVIYFKTIGWNETKVTRVKDTMQICSSPGRNFFFKYNNDHIEKRNHIREFTYVVNGVEYSHDDCVGEDTSVKTLAYNPVNPQEVFPERAQQYLMGISYVAIGIGMMIMAWFSRDFDNDRPSI